MFADLHPACAPVSESSEPSHCPAVWTLPCDLQRAWQRTCNKTQPINFVDDDDDDDDDDISYYK